MALKWLDLHEFVSGCVRGNERFGAVLLLLALIYLPLIFDTLAIF